ncbi:MAG: cadherin-like beta sandwich domain-containing protein, partial [Sphingobacteriales bacterium]
AYTLTADGNSTTNDAPAPTNNASFGSSVTSVIINPAANAGASVSVKRADGSGPDAGEGFSLAVGENTFNILVTAEDNVTTVNYQLVITRAAPLPANTNLTLSISGRSLLSKQARGAANVNYKTSVDPATASIDVTPKTEDPLATVTVNGTTVTRGTAATVQLPANPTEINMLVTAQNGQTKTYQIIVEKNGSNNADLDITLSSKSILYQTTGTAQVNYRTTVDAGTESIMIKPRSDEPNAVVTVNGIVVPRSTFSEPIALDGQLTIIDMRIVAQDGVTSRTYTIAVTKTGSNNANMKFALSGKPVLNPLSGGPAQENYKTTVAVGTSSITITPTFEDANASAIIDGQPVANKTASQPIVLNTPTKLVTMLVTAQDGITTRSYSVEITKAGSNNANIAIKLTPASKLAGVNAGPAMYNYTTSVDPATTVLTVKPTSEEPNAIVTVDGNEVVRGASAQVALNVDGIT